MGLVSLVISDCCFAHKPLSKKPFCVFSQNSIIAKQNFNKRKTYMMKKLLEGKMGEAIVRYLATA